MTARIAGQGGTHDFAAREPIDAEDGGASPSAAVGSGPGPIEDELRSLREAIEDLRGRQSAYDDQLHAVAVEMSSMRGFREHTESELSKLRIDLSTLASVIDELAGLPAEIRVQFEPELDAVRDQLQLQLVEVQSARPAVEATEPAEAMVPPAAAAVSAAEATEPLTPPADAEQFTPARVEPSDDRGPWLAEAIRNVAQRRDAVLAAELIAELLPVHGMLSLGTLSYEVAIDEFGSFVVHVNDGCATVTRTSRQDRDLRERFDFRLAGPALALAALGGGGLTGRWLRGVRVRGSRRKTRRLLKVCRRPLALSDLVQADIAVWPGLLLPALAEAVPSKWTSGHSFIVRFVIDGQPPTAIYVQVCNGAPIGVSAHVGDADQRVASTVYLNERAFLCAVAGCPLSDEERMLVAGEAEPVHMLLRWFMQAQASTRSHT